MDRGDKQYYENESAFSFGVLFKFIKKALPMVLVFVIAAIIIGCVAGGVLTMAGSERHESSVYFNLNYTGADKGETPEGERLIVNDFTTLDKINKVLKDNSLTYDAAALKSAIIIEGVYDSNTVKLIESLQKDPVKLEAYFKSSNIAPTRYKMSINQDKINGAKEAELNVFLNALVEYNRVLLFDIDFSTYFLASTSFNEEYFAGRSQIAQYIALEKEIDRFSSHIDNVKADRLNIDIKAVDLAPIVNNINLIDSMMVSYETYLLTNSITMDITSTITYLKAELVAQKTQLQRYETEEVSLAKMIKDYNVTQIVISADGTISAPGQLAIEALNNLYNKQSSVVSSKATVMANISKMESRLTEYEKFGSTGATPPTAAQIEEASRQVNLIFDLVSKSTARYETLLGASKASIESDGFKATSAVSLRVSASQVSWILILAIAMAVGLVGGLIAYKVYEGIAIKNKKAALATASGKQDKLDNVLEAIDNGATQDDNKGANN